MSKIRMLPNGGQVFFCPGCKSTHALNSHPQGPRWTYNGDADAPTFAPSVLVTCQWSQVDETMKDEVCHSFVRNGRIEFLGDCTHELIGQAVELPEWPYEPGKYGGIIDPEPAAPASQEPNT